jgi:hypothetical protein
VYMWKEQCRHGGDLQRAVTHDFENYNTFMLDVIQEARIILERYSVWVCLCLYSLGWVKPCFLPPFPHLPRLAYSRLSILSARARTASSPHLHPAAPHPYQGPFLFWLPTHLGHDQ